MIFITESTENIENNFPVQFSEFIPYTLDNNTLMCLLL